MQWGEDFDTPHHFPARFAVNILKKSSPAHQHTKTYWVQMSTHTHKFTEDKALSYAWAEGLM